MEDFFSDPRELLKLYNCDDQVSSLAALCRTNHTSGRIVEAAIRLGMVLAIHAAERRFALREANLDSPITPFSTITYRDVSRAELGKG